MNSTDFKCGGSKKTGMQGFNGELQVFFGSIFYPKDMKQALEAVDYQNSR
jgi:hypothetical protein